MEHTKHVLVFRKPILLIYKKVGIWNNHLWVVMETDLSKISQMLKRGAMIPFWFLHFFPFEKPYQTYVRRFSVGSFIKKMVVVQIVRTEAPLFFSSTFVYPKFDNELEQIKHCRHHKFDTNPNFFIWNNICFEGNWIPSVFQGEMMLTVKIMPAFAEKGRENINFIFRFGIEGRALKNFVFASSVLFYDVTHGWIFEGPMSLWWCG